jgi:integrase
MGVVKRKNPSGKVVWGIQWIDEHGQRRRRFEEGWRERDAKRAFEDVVVRKSAGVATSPVMTVAELFREWHANHVMVNCSPAYVGDVERQYRLRIGPMIGHRVIDTVNRRLVRQMVAQMQQVMRAKDPGNEYAGHATVNKTLTVVKGMFTYAVQIDLLVANPANGVPELPEEPTRQIDAWPIEAVHAVAVAAARRGEGLPEFQRSQRAAWASERDYTLIMLAALTGLRQSELLGLTWDRIEADWIHVTRKLCRRSFTLRETKSRRGQRRVPVLDATGKLLAAWRAVGAHEEIVFPNNDGKSFMRAEHFDAKVWNKARRKAGTVDAGGREVDCARMTFHELRHTFVSLCLAAGRDVWEVACWAGDDPDMIKQTYGHYIPDSLGDTGRLDRALHIPGPLQLGR